MATLKMIGVVILGLLCLIGFIQTLGAIFGFWSAEQGAENFADAVGDLIDDLLDD